MVLMGAGWGFTMPLSKIAVSEGYRHFGLIFWQNVIVVMVLGLLSLLRRKGLPLGRVQLGLYLFIALSGTIFPNSFSYEAARHLPAGVVSIVMSTIPMFALLIALPMGNDTFAWPRMAGLVLGLIGVLLLVVPDASLPSSAMTAFIPLALLAPLAYGIEGNVVARWGTFGCDAIQVLLGASLVGLVIVTPLAVFSNQWIAPHLAWRAPDYALLASSIIHALAYTGYVWLVGRAGSVFAAQSAYLVTGFGVFWSMILLSEGYSHWIWLALAFILCGLFLVQPRPRNLLAVVPETGETSGP
jgi:drug/metabolite transporter (DMT)-like permease